MVQKSEHMFEKVKLTPVDFKIIIHLARSPDEEFYLRELAEITDVSLGGCHKSLKRIHDMGIVEKKKSGRNLYYKINTENKSIQFLKIFINIQELEPLTRRIKDMGRKIVLFGSCATGDDTLESDIDLFIVAEDIDGVKKKIGAKRLNERELRPVIMKPHEVIGMKKNNPGFYEEINKGITLWRNPDDI